MLSEPATYREGVESLLAKNLVIARLLAGLTQRELADASSVSRATIAQLETGYSDPRLSTIVDLATALGIPPIVLLLGIDEVRVLAELLGAVPASRAGEEIPLDSSQPDGQPLPVISSTDLARMEDYLRSGMLKDRLRAAKVGAAVVRASGDSIPATPIIAGIFSPILPGAGTIAGAAFGKLLARYRR